MCWLDDLIDQQTTAGKQWRDGIYFSNLEMSITTASDAERGPGLGAPGEDILQLR